MPNAKPALIVLSDAEMGFRMLGVMAKFERASLAMQAKCEYIGGFIPYGYQLVDDDKTLIEVSEEQKIIQLKKQRDVQ